MPRGRPRKIEPTSHTKLHNPFLAKHEKTYSPTKIASKIHYSYEKCSLGIIATGYEPGNLNHEEYSYYTHLAGLLNTKANQTTPVPKTLNTTKSCKSPDSSHCNKTLVPIKPAPKNQQTESQQDATIVKRYSPGETNGEFSFYNNLCNNHIETVELSGSVSPSSIEPTAFYANEQLIYQVQLFGKEGNGSIFIEILD